jgi:hypothetical protein
MEQKILEHYKNWLILRGRLPETSSSDQEPISNSETVQNVDVPNENNETFSNFPIDSHNSVKVFENNQIEMFIKKSFHQRQVRFRLQDSMFHIKVKTKQDSTNSLLFDLMEVFERVQKLS